MSFLIAMQKVVGSNPISRFASNPLHLGRSALAGKIKPPPHIASVLGTSPKMTRMHGD